MNGAGLNDRSEEARVKTIWKFQLDPTNEVVQMPRGAGVLSAGAQGDEIVVWARVDTAQPKVGHRFVVVGTGHDAERTVGCNPVGTVQMSNGLVFHVWDGFEVAIGGPR
jgi:hypothetical protein